MGIILYNSIFVTATTVSQSKNPFLFRTGQNHRKNSVMPTINQLISTVSPTNQQNIPI